MNLGGKNVPAVYPLFRYGNHHTDRMHIHSFKRQLDNIRYDKNNCYEK